MKIISPVPLLVLALSVITAFSSCKKDPEPEPEPLTGSMNVQFSYVFGATQSPFELGKAYVHPKTGDTLTFTTFRFYVSNVKLRKADGTWWVQPESYYLLDAGTAPASAMSIAGIPVGSYTAMEYTMGVDSQRNVSGANTGALSLSNGMYWDWNSGYIMLKAEGNSPQAENGGFAIHPGGFSGAYNIVTIKTADFGSSKLNIDTTGILVVKMVANPSALWNTIPGVKTLPTIHMPGADAMAAAKDFYNSISFTGIQ